VSLDDAINILSIGTSLLNMAHTLSGGSIPSVPSVPRAATSAAAHLPTPSASYPSSSSAPTGRPMNCTMGADNWLTCK
jgi:hypothetical protein